MKKTILLILAAAILFAACSVYAEEPPAFSTFGEAVNAAMRTAEEGDTPYCISGEGYCIALIRQEGRFFRAVTFFDEHGYELYNAFVDASAPEEGKIAEDEHRALDDYLMTLPVQYTEELTVVPLGREELDAMAGKTIAEVMSEPWEMGMMNYPEDADANGDVIFPMVKGFCRYELAINEPFEVYQERRACDHYDPVTVMSLRNYEDLTVKYVRYSGLSDNMLFLRYQADGTRADAADICHTDAETIFETLAGLEWSYCSGAGAWSSDMTIQADGSFICEYHDSDMGDSADAYPNGTLYFATFRGRMSMAEQADENTWRIRVDELCKDPGEEEILDGIRYVPADSCGLSEGDIMTLYAPGTPADVLSEEMQFWAQIMYQENPDVLENWFLGSEANDSGFVGYPAVSMENP